MSLSAATYIGFEDKEDVARQFEEDLGDDIEILVAAYEAADYEGDAFVLFRKDGKLYEVNASHCSCYGLEDQWEPEEVTDIDTLVMRFPASYGCLASIEVQKAVLALKEN